MGGMEFPISLLFKKLFVQLSFRHIGMYLGHCFFFTTKQLIILQSS